MSALGVAREARADFDLQVAASGGGGFMRETPSFATREVSTAARDLPEGTEVQRSPFGLALAGMTTGAALTWRSGLVVPVVAFGVYFPVGAYGRVPASVDGSVAELRPWTAYRLDAALPGLGYRINRRRFTFGGAIRPAVAWMRVSGAVASGATAEQVHVSDTGFVVQAELEVCRRFDPTTRGCLEITPRVLDMGTFVNGGLVSLRLELGL